MLPPKSLPQIKLLKQRHQTAPSHKRVSPHLPRMSPGPQSPEPVRKPTPEPVQQREPTPEPIQQREPTPEPVREPTPEPVREPTPEPVREPTPEPVRELTPELQDNTAYSVAPCGVLTDWSVVTGPVN
uniref:Uncharacterized protein n=1 Tax=Xiphophorus couchianus TaxID=32473 RepID=A0A3B5MAW1_9TELE